MRILSIALLFRLFDLVVSFIIHFVSSFIGKVYYKTSKPVPADHELLVWYGESYARDLGILPGQELTVYQIHRNPGECIES